MASPDRRHASGSRRQSPRPVLIPNPKLKLADQCREVLRFQHYAYRTELTYLAWVERYVRFCRVEKSDAVERVLTGLGSASLRRRLHFNLGLRLKQFPGRGKGNPFGGKGYGGKGSISRQSGDIAKSPATLESLAAHAHN